ncbi:rab-like protein 3 isoform X2 [Varroa destructor]|uniref:Uncharacterized protein n=1 Tax=Varroa destructor TaxID=109461 RepID=A0A7M7JF37_VARDE|nr:rab-like protein 3 isoform X2 [Varroa destructor]
MNIDKEPTNNERFLSNFGRSEATRATPMLDESSIIPSMIRLCLLSIAGIVLVHDLTNSKSHDHLKMWLADAVTRRSGGEFDAEMFADLQVPVLVVGTKLSRARVQHRRGTHIADLCGAEQIFVDSTGDGEHSSSLAPGSSNAVKLSRFFDKVIEKQYYSSKNVLSPQPPSAFGDRRRPANSPRFLQHVD